MFLLFDIGGTSTRLAITKDKKKFEKPLIYPTPQNYKTAIAAIVGNAKVLSKGEKITKAIGGVAGTLEEGKIVGAKNLPRWIGKNLKKDLEKALKTKVYLENDTTMGGLGEIYFGSGTKKGVCAYITVSSGVGGKRFINGKLDSSLANAEPGKIVLEFGTNYKNLEDVVSGKAIESQFRCLPSDVKDAKFWDLEAKRLAAGLLGISLMWRPEVLVLGGGVVTTTKLSVPLVAKYVKQLRPHDHFLPKIVKSKLGDLNGLYGSLVMLGEVV